MPEALVAVLMIAVWGLSILLSIGQLICWIMVLVKFFKNDNVAMGIIGIFCGIVAFIGGWIKAGEYQMTKLMLAWTALFGLQILVSIVAVVIGALAAAAAS